MFIFPGQGSQYKGMGKDLIEKSNTVREIYNKASSVLGYDISELSFHDKNNEINLTKYTQPVLMTHQIACYEYFKDFHGGEIKPMLLAGHSLGEYTALVCAGSLTIERAAYLLHERGKSMQDAVPAGQGAMMAILGLTVSEVEKEINLLPNKEICEIANDNSIGQVVISGEKKVIENFSENLKKKKKRERKIKQK